MSSRHSADNKIGRPGLEFLLFVLVSALGVYSLGQGLIGLDEPGRGLDLLWFAVTTASIMILFAQMGRVQDTWPRRDDSHSRSKSGGSSDVPENP